MATLIISVLIFALLAFAHWCVLRRRCFYKHMVKSKCLIPVYKGGMCWKVKFSPGKVLGLFPCWVYWQKYYPSGRYKYRVSNGEIWIKNKIKEVQNLQKNNR